MLIEIDYDPSVDELKDLINESPDQDEILEHVLDTADIAGIMPRLQEVIAEGNTAWLHDLAFSMSIYRTAAVLKETHSKPNLAELVKLLVDAL